MGYFGYSDKASYEVILRKKAENKLELMSSELGRMSSEKTKLLEVKSHSIGNSFVNFLSGRGFADLAAHTALMLTSRNAPLGNAVDILAKEVSSLTPRVFDHRANKYLETHPVLDLLDFPNADSTRAEFMYRLVANFIPTGNDYIVATGPVNSPPLELENQFPQRVNVLGGSNDNFAETITVTGQSIGTTFTREEVNGRLRFYHEDTREIWQIKRFNPWPNVFTGQSILTSVFSEIEQYDFASTHNSSLLARGARPSGILLASTAIGKNGDVAQPLSDEQYERIKEQWNNFNSGAENAGSTFIAEGTKVDYKPLITSNRDMDFMAGKKDVSDRIYNQLDIPLPFVSSERQTFSNMGVAKEQLYDNAVIPLAARIYAELSLFLLPRYLNSENLEITFNEAEIPALQSRKIRQVKERREIGIDTIDELRAMLGQEALKSGGDQLYINGSLVPIGSDKFIENQPDVPAKRDRK